MLAIKPIAARIPKKINSSDISYAFLFVNTNPATKDVMEAIAPNPYTMRTLDPKSLKNEDTITPVKTYLDMSIK